MFRKVYACPAYNSKYGRALVPLRYFFELTYRCNLQCPYCYVGNDRNKQELSTQDWFDVIEQIPLYSFVTLVGGEPLIRADFVEILEKVCRKTFGKVNVVSTKTKVLGSFESMSDAFAAIKNSEYGETGSRINKLMLSFKNKTKT